jgi:hypothetical protein
LKHPQSPYKHLRIGNNFYQIAHTKGTYIQLLEETNPAIKKELKSFWQKVSDFLKKIFNKKEK